MDSLNDIRIECSILNLHFTHIKFRNVSSNYVEMKIGWKSHYSVLLEENDTFSGSLRYFSQCLLLKYKSLVDIIDIL